MLDNVIRLLVILIQLYSLVILVRIILSWFPNLDRSNQIVRLLHQVTDPVLEPVRRVVPPIGMVDISPILVFIGLYILQRVLLSMAGSM